MPFGGGRQRCLGSHLALLELRTVIPEVLKRVRLTAPDPTPEQRRLRHATLVPSELTQVIARPIRDEAGTPTGAVGASST
jgi:cytochrome P450 family 135